MTVDACFKIGYVQKTHGLKGEVTAVFDPGAPDADNLSEIQTFFLGEGNQIAPYFISSISVRNSKAFIKLEDVDSIEEAQKLVRKSIFLERSARPKKGKGEFYDDEVIDFEVTDAQAGILGKVKEVVQAGTNRLLMVVHEGKEVLIPINSPFITALNKRGKSINVNLPDGFLDI